MSFSQQKSILCRFGTCIISLMRVLWFNWRDILNPEAGGAEVYTHEIMKRLAKRGHEMTLFTSKFKGCELNENIDGVDIIREGNKYRVYLKAKNYWKA